MDSILEKLGEEIIAREKPLCPVFGNCGGCAFQNIAYEDELRLKEKHFKDLFQKKLGLADNLFHPIEASVKPYHYRNRLDVGLYRFRNGEILMGFRHPETHRTIPIDSCAIAREEISDYLPQLKEEALAKFPANYDIANLVIRTGDDGRVRWGGIGRRSLAMKEEDYFWTQINGRKIFYSLETFFQANLSILPSVMKKIESFKVLDQKTVFFDLYSGVGLFGLALADYVKQVIMVEEAPSSVKLAQYNVTYNGLGHKIKIHNQKSEQTLYPEKGYLGTPSQSAGSRVAMIDPPRKGLSEPAREMLAGSNLDAFFYLSCSPESLLRDSAAFTRRGWQIRALVPFDFFPKTPHLETLALFERQG